MQLRASEGDDDDDDYYYYYYYYYYYTPWSESLSELYRPSDRRLSAMLVQTFFG
jgi:hypothetical protein